MQNSKYKIVLYLSQTGRLTKCTAGDFKIEKIKNEKYQIKKCDFSKSGKKCIISCFAQKKRNERMDDKNVRISSAYRGKREITRDLNDTQNVVDKYTTV